MQAATADQPPSARGAVRRRRRLLDAAVAVLAEEGLERTTTRRVTDRAGLALGAFHHTFRSKDELLESLGDQLVEEVEDVLRSAVRGDETSLPVALHRLVEAYWSLVRQAPERQLARYELTVHALRTPALRRIADQQYERYAAVVEQALIELPGGPQGTSRSDLARYVVATFDGLVLHQLIAGEPEASRPWLELHLRALDVLTAA